MTDEAVPFRFSRESQIRIDRDGHFWHEGTRVEHARLERALATWVELEDATGRFILKNDAQWCYVEVDDTPLVVRNVWVDARAGAVEAELSDGTRETVVLSTLRIDEDSVVYCDVRGGRLPARFDRTAAFTLLQHAEPGADDRVVLKLANGEATEVARVSRGEGKRTWHRPSQMFTTS